jgi:hypothetical protein
VVKEGGLEGFGFEYTAGTVRGQLKAGIESAAAEHSYQLKVHIDEKTP